MAVSNKEIRRRERVQRERQAKYEYKKAGKKKDAGQKANYKEYNELREKYLKGQNLSQKEAQLFRKQADLLAQELTNKTYLDGNDFKIWRSLPTRLQGEIKNRRAAAIAKKYGLGDWRQFMTNAVPKVLGLAGTVAGGIGGAAATGGLGAAGGAALGNAAGETLGQLGTAAFNKLFPGGPQDPETAQQRELLRQEALLDYYRPQQEPFYYEPQRNPQEQQALSFLRSRSGRGKQYDIGYDYINPMLQSAVPTLQRAAAQPAALASGAKQGITGLWNRIYGRRS